jgi:hypothetical protein
MAHVHAEIRTDNLLNTNLELYLYINLLGESSLEEWGVFIHEVIYLLSSNVSFKHTGYSVHVL